MITQPECSQIEQRTIIEFLVAEKYKPIFKRMCNVYKEACFNQKTFINRLNMGLSLQVWVEKTVHGVETHCLSGKEKVPGMMTVF